MYTCQAERGRILNASPYYSDDRATLYGGDALAVLLLELANKGAE